MPRQGYGPTAKRRAKRFLEALLDYAKYELELDETVCKKLKVTLEKDGLGLFVVGTKELFTELTKADRQPGKLSEREVETAIAYLEDFLEILKKHTQQGSKEWRLRITLWHSDKEKNLKAFEEECKRKKAEKKPKVSQDPWVQVRKFVPSEFELLDEKFFRMRGRGDSPILRLPSATWSLITKGNYIDRDRQNDLLTQAEDLAEYDGISLLLIRGQPGAGKTALMRWLAYQLSSQESIVLQKKPRRDDLYWLESLGEFTEQIHYRHFYLIADDLFRDETILEELEHNELQFPLTLIGTTRLNEDQQERLRRWGYPIQSLDLELYPSEKERIWQRVGEQDSEAKVRLERLPPAERDRLMASPSMLVLMLQLSEGKEFDLIVADVIKRLPSETDYPVYQVFGVICSFYQYSLMAPPEILPLCLPDYSSKAVRDVVDIATQAELKGLVNSISWQKIQGLRTIHQLIAQTVIAVKYSRRQGENLPYSSRLLADYLRRVIQTLDPTKETHKRWAYHGLRLLAVNGADALVRQVLHDYPEKIQTLQQEENGITGWSIWGKIYEALGLFQERDRCFNAMLSTEPQTAHERSYWLSLVGRLGTFEQQREAIVQTATWLQHHSEDHLVRTQYLALIGQYGTQQQKQEAISQTATWLQHHPDNQQVRRQYLALIRQFGKPQQKREAITQTATWLQQHQENTSVRAEHIGLIGQYGTLQQKREMIAQSTTWLQQHPENTNIRQQYLALIGPHGTSEQKREAIAQTATWLQHHSDNQEVRKPYLALIGQYGTSEQKREAIAQTATWLQHHPDNKEVRTQYLALIGQCGTSEQKQEAIAQTATWLQHHPENSNVRTQYLALIGQYGTPQQKQEAIAQTTTWLQQHQSYSMGYRKKRSRRRRKKNSPVQAVTQLQHHPETGAVRAQYLVLVGKAGKDIIDLEPIIAQQWQWISQQPRIEQSLWTAFLPVLHYQAQAHLNSVPFIEPAIQLALEQYPENRTIISNVFGYFRDYLDYETCYRLAEVISEREFINNINLWRHFIHAANFFRDYGELDKAEVIYRRVLKTAESWLNRKKCDRKNLAKTINFASLSYAYLLLLRQPPDVYQAIDYLEPILDDNPKHGLAHCYMALGYQAKGDNFYPQAIQHFEKSIQFDQQKTGHFWHQFGCFYRDVMKDRTTAWKCFKNSLKQKVNLPACVGLANLEIESGNYQIAQKLLQQGIALVPITRPEKEQREKLQPRIDSIQKAIDIHHNSL